MLVLHLLHSSVTWYWLVLYIWVWMWQALATIFFIMKYLLHDHYHIMMRRDFYFYFCLLYIFRYMQYWIFFKPTLVHRCFLFICNGFYMHDLVYLVRLFLRSFYNNLDHKRCIHDWLWFLSRHHSVATFDGPYMLYVFLITICMNRVKGHFYICSRFDIQGWFLDFFFTHETVL